MVPSIMGSSQGSDGEGNTGRDCSPVENAGMVSSDDGDGNRPPNSPSGTGQHSNSISELRVSSTNGHSKVGRMEGLRRQLSERAIPEKAGELILASWQSKTNANYNSSWRKWEEWCKPRDIHPFSSGISRVLGFLADQFEAGRQYQSLNCYRSAISSCHLPIDGFAVGQHPLVSGLLKGAGNLRPPQPKYSHAWEVDKVLDLLKTLGSNDRLTLEQLIRKLVTLLVLVMAHRASDLVRLSLTRRTYIPEGVILICKGSAKTTRPGNEKDMQSVVITSFEETVLCPVACLRAYEAATEEFRFSEDRMQLFLATIVSHGPVTSSTISTM